MWWEYSVHICPLRLPLRCLRMLVIKHHSYYPWFRTQNHWFSVDAHFQDHVSIRVDYSGSQYIENGLWCTKVNISQSTVTYMNATINVKPKTRNWRLEPTVVVKPGETGGSPGEGSGFAHQQSVDQVFGRVCNWTDLFFWSKPGHHQDLLLKPAMQDLSGSDSRHGVRILCCIWTLTRCKHNRWHIYKSVIQCLLF
jgi:hypothetical protein